jgi:hypothetical protein
MTKDNRDIWQEVLDGIKEIKEGGGHYHEVERLTADDALWDNRELGADSEFAAVIEVSVPSDLRDDLLALIKKHDLISIRRGLREIQEEILQRASEQKQ